MHTGFAERWKNDLNGLAWIDRFGWLRSAELSRFMFKKYQDKSARACTDRVLRSWLSRGLVIQRQLPDGNGKCYVLSEAGAGFLKDAKVDKAKTGKDIGSITQGEWYPPARWKHALIASGVLSLLAKQGYQVTTEREILRIGLAISKIPDGVAVKDDVTYWVEVEQAEKKGPYMDNLVAALVALGTGGVHLGKLHATASLVVVPPSIDSRGCVVNHRQRITDALKAKILADIPVNWLTCEMSGFGVAAIAEPENEVIESDLVSRIERTLRNTGWHPAADGVGEEAHYDDLSAVIWNDEHHGWSFMLEGRENLPGAGQSGTKTAAKRGAAYLLSVHASLHRSQKG